MSGTILHRLLIGIVLAAACAGILRSASAQTAEITVATWGGVYGEALHEAVFKPFSRATGIGIRIHHHGSNYLPLRDGEATWDVVDVERAPLTEGCANGTYRKLDPALLLGNGAADDFLTGTLHPCGIGAMIWTQAVAYDATVFKDNPPHTLADFFDLNAYPGKRGLFAEAEGNLEIALMADGIPPEDVYDILRKPGGVDHALAILDRIRSVAVFWQGGDEPEQLLNEGRAVMTTAYAARFLRPRQGARRPAKLLLRNQLWRTTYWAIPDARADLPGAQRFISFATDPDRLSALAARLWFGPARKSGLAAVPENMRADLPTARGNFHDALQIDSGFWAEFGPGIEQRFRAWRRG